MSLLFTLAGLAAFCALTFFPTQLQLTPEISSRLQLATVALLALAGLLQLVGLLRRKPTPAKAPSTPAAKADSTLVQPSAESQAQAQVVQLLARLQEKGRLVDFIMDDITPYSNEEIGAGARVVHQGCNEVLKEMFDIQAVHLGDEGETLSLAADFDARAYRLVGSVPEQPPFTGTVLHRGWKTSKVTLPRLTDTAREVIAPAEVEIS
jgi:Domain of unknown function (DUF2760)